MFITNELRNFYMLHAKVFIKEYYYAEFATSLEKKTTTAFDYL